MTIGIAINAKDISLTPAENQWKSHKNCAGNRSLKTPTTTARNAKFAGKDT